MYKILHKKRRKEGRGKEGGGKWGLEEEESGHTRRRRKLGITLIMCSVVEGKEREEEEEIA